MVATRRSTFGRFASTVAIVAYVIVAPRVAVRAAETSGFSAMNPVREDVEQRCAKASDPRTSAHATRAVRFVTNGGKTLGPWKRDVDHRSESVISGGPDMFEQLDILDVRVAAGATEATVRRLTAIGQTGASQSWCYLAGKLARARVSGSDHRATWTHTKWFDETGALANESSHIDPVGARSPRSTLTDRMRTYPTFETNPYYAPYRAARSKTLEPLTVPIVRDV